MGRSRALNKCWLLNKKYQAENVAIAVEKMTAK